MALYFKDIEITNIDNLVPQSGLDITDIWFGSTNVYTVWATYEGTLPTTINANGDDMKQYQIYGNTGGVGDRTINLLDFEDFVENMNLNTTTGLPTAYPGRVATENPIDVSSYDAVTIFYEGAQSIETLRAILSTFTSNGELISRVANIGSGDVVNTSNVAYMYVCIYQVNLLNIYKSDVLNAMLTPGTTPPETYVPFGYEVDMGVSDGTTLTVTPIYIGDDPLEKVSSYVDYIDYSTQKIIRNVKKMILTGSENWQLFNAGTANAFGYSTVLPAGISANTPLRCSHLQQAAISTSNTNIGIMLLDNQIRVRLGNMPSYTLSSFKQWLANQYESNTPVIVWYAITQIATDPPVPLPALPTVEGTTIVDYAGSGTTPEKVLLKYRKENF